MQGHRPSIWITHLDDFKKHIPEIDHYSSD